MFLIQLLLPAIATPATEDGGIARTRAELVERFGGVTAYAWTPADGEWRDERGRTAEDKVVLVEVVARAFERAWWEDYASRLAKRFAQHAVHIRAIRVQMIDPKAT